MRRTAILAALADVHHAEKSMQNPNGVPRSRAVRDAIKAHALTDDETQVLLNATHVSRSEIEV
jgi:hypothetical protein